MGSRDLERLTEILGHEDGACVCVCARARASVCLFVVLFVCVNKNPPENAFSLQGCVRAISCARVVAVCVNSHAPLQKRSCVRARMCTSYTGSQYCFSKQKAARSSPKRMPEPNTDQFSASSKIALHFPFGHDVVHEGINKGERNIYEKKNRGD